MAHESAPLRHAVAPRIATTIAALAAPVLAGPVEDMLAAADRGECIEQVAHDLIRRDGPGAAGDIVESALLALARRERQQRAMGCDGDIAARAIAAGADPAQVLEATAAGL